MLYKIGDAQIENVYEDDDKDIKKHSSKNKESKTRKKLDKFKKDSNKIESSVEENHELN